ncbi:MAG: hypothetical protein H6935_16410 [Thiobacillus sp.]|nr:hypothetical protein [Thiobacillus sp.]
MVKSGCFSCYCIKPSFHVTYCFIKEY